MPEEIITFLTASILLTISPGPDIIFVLVQGMINGNKSGVFTALGLVTGIVFHTALVAFGVSAILRESPVVFLIIKIAGACYLFFLAYQVFKSRPEIAFSTEKAPSQSTFNLFKKALLMNLLNPKVGIFFLAFFPGFLWNPDKNILLQFFVLGLLFMLQAFLIFCLVALLSGKIAGYLKKHHSSGVILKWVQVMVFIGIGIYILF